MIHYLPIEPIPARYTEQMVEWVIGAMALRRIPFTLYTPYRDRVSNVIGESSQFLDAFESTRYKAMQVELLLAAMREGQVSNGDVILLGDCWFPGIEGIKLAADCAGIKVRFAGWHYAGVHDVHDHYHRTLGPWARTFEAMVVRDIMDLVCCGSEFHRAFLTRAITCNEDKVKAHGLVWRPEAVGAGRGAVKEDIVVFPHRMAQEKSPEDFIRAAAALRGRGWRFVFSLTRPAPAYYLDLASTLGSPVEFIVQDSKEGFYALLDRAKIVYSAAHQETFGYAIHEGIAHGCALCLPARACHRETVDGDGRFLYDPILDPSGVNRLLSLMRNWEAVPYAATERWRNGLDLFLDDIEAL